MIINAINKLKEAKTNRIISWFFIKLTWCFTISWVCIFFGEVVQES
jgi:hypothetical protein